MVWWQTAVVALGSSVVGGVLTSWGSYLVFIRQLRARRRVEAERIVAAASAALREADPHVWVERLQVGENARALMEEKRARWLEAAAGLDVLRAMHPETDVATLAEAAIRRGRLVVIRLDEEVGHPQYPDEPWWDAVGGAHAEATRALDQLMLAIHRNARRYRFHLGRAIAA